tara:strand:+ start:3260 stop:4324 length:1065 start_codon:yes stop_codon:yes gene_type:complete
MEKKNFQIIEPSNLKKFTHQNPEKVLFDNLYKKFGERYVNYRKRYEDNVKNLDMLKVEPYPNTVILELVNRCNLECVMCYQGFRNDAKKSTLDEKILDKIFADFKENNLNSLMLSTSEPLLFKNINQVLKRAEDAGIMDIFLFTNGVLLNEKNTKMILESPVTRLFVSIDGYSEETYNKVRIPVSKRLKLENDRLSKLEKNIRYFMEQREKKNLSLPLVRTSFVSLKENKLESQRFVDKWKNLVDSVEVQKETSIKAFKDFEKMKDQEIPRLKKNYSCSEPWGQITIHADGEVAPCCNTFGRNLPIGNIKENSLKEIWNSEKMKKIRDGFFKNEPNKTCQICINNTSDEEILVN